MDNQLLNQETIKQHLSVYQVVSGDTAAVRCQNQLPFVWHGQSISAPGDYTTVLTSQAGCDSTVTLHFIVNQVVTGDTAAVRCQNQLPFVWHGQSISAPGDYTTVLTSQAGCDSTVTLHFTVNQVVTGDTAAVRCQNQLPFVWHGQSISAPGDYTTVLTSQAGCDSTVTLHFTVSQVVTGDTAAVRCQNQLPFVWHGQSITQPGDYQTTLISVSGSEWRYSSCTLSEPTSICMAWTKYQCTWRLYHSAYFSSRM